MPAVYSTDLRQRVIDAYQAQEGSQNQLAERFKVSLSFVRRLVRRHRQSGKVTPKPHGGGANAKIAQQHWNIVRRLVEQQPDALLSELCDRFERETQIGVSVPTMHRAVQRLGLSLKKNLERDRATQCPDSAVTL